MSPDAPRRRPLEPPGASGRSWLPVGILVVGLAAAPLLFAANLVRHRLIASDVAALRAVDGIETLTATAHLWIEELVSGDTVEVGEIEESLERARELAEAATLALQERGESAETTVSWRVVAGIDRFTRLTAARRTGFDLGQEVGIGSPVDVEYDRAFAALLEDVEDLETILVGRLERSVRRVNQLFSAFLAVWIFGVVLAAAGLWSRKRHQRRAEAALRESEARFLESQKREAIGRLAGGIAHDINNYLAAITAQCELVKMRSEPDGDTATRMDAVLTTAGGASALIERLLAFSRRQPARPEPVDLNAVIRAVETMLRRLLGADVQLETDLEVDLWPVKMDRSQAEQILLNLAVNARDAMPTGGVLRVETSRGASGEVILRVSDQGEGIPQALQKKVFEPFFTTKEATHSGLGLSTVLGIVEQNGGRIRVEDRPGGGTVFEVSLPRTLETTRPAPRQDEVARPPAGGGRRVLLVEDNHRLRQSTRDLLMAWSFSVVEAEDGEEALRRFGEAEAGFDLLLTDVVMPGRSGREIADRLREDAPVLPVLFMSGYADDVVLRHGIATGEVHYLQKPFTAAELAEKVRETLA